MPEEKHHTGKYRYPGVTPFTSDQRDIFFGRNQDITNLYRAINWQRLMVLYSKSGLGKSSLLNAGIIPLCLEKGDFAPIVIRFGAWTEGATKTPLETTREVLAREDNHPTLLDKLLPGDNSLWYYTKSHQLREKHDKNPLLMFDQFEELFSYPEEQIIEFQKELSELPGTDIPLRFLSMAGDADILSDEEEEALEKPLEAHILFAIRSDRIHLLDRLKDYLPMVLRHTYELKALTRQDARAAIVEPAKAIGDFNTAPFQFSPEALDVLMDYLKDEQDKERRVEGILLQMLCEYYERNIAAQKKLKYLDLKHIGAPEDVVKKYYLEKIQNLPVKHQIPARKLIEEGLVSEGEAMRLTLHESFIRQEYGVEKKLLERLVDSRLLRSEPFIRGGYTYELSHDRLVSPILEARNKRREEEQLEQLEKAQKRIAREIHLKEQAQANEVRAKQRTRLALLGLIAATIALVAAIYFGYNAIQQKQAAEKARTEAQDNLIDNYNSEIKRYQGEINTAQRNRNAFERYNADEDVIELENQKIDSLSREIRYLEEKIKVMRTNEQ